MKQQSAGLRLLLCIAAVLLGMMVQSAWGQAVLSNPSPGDGQIDVPSNVTLSWECTLPGATFDVYLEHSLRHPPFSEVDVTQGLSEPTLTLSLAGGMRCRWWIVATSGDTQVTGPVWSFTTDEPNDINHDGFVNVGDLQLLVAAWGSGPNYTGREDVNRDGFVNVGDLQRIICIWGQSL